MGKPAFQLWRNVENMNQKQGPKSIFEDFISDPDRYKLFLEEAICLDATELICKIMQESGITQSELAARLKISKVAISNLFRNFQNISLKRLSRILFALGYKIKLDCEPL